MTDLTHPQPIHDKLRLLSDHKAWKWKKRPACTAETAQLYCRKERLAEHEVWAANAHQDRRGLIWTAVDRALGTWKPCPRTRCPLFCDRYLCDAAYRWLCNACQSPDSWTSYIKTLRDWTAFSERRILHQQCQATTRDVQDYLYRLEFEGKAPRTIKHARDVLRGWYGYLTEIGLMERPPFNKDIQRTWKVADETLAIQGGHRNALTADEAAKVGKWAATVAEPVVGLSVLLQVTAGLRSAEVAQLERKNLREQDGVWSLTVLGKGRRVRTIVLEAITVRAWVRYATERRLQGNRGALLSPPGGGHYSRHSIQRWARDAARVVHREGQISSHCLRRTAASLLLDNGARLDQVSGLLGHKSLDMTSRCYVVRYRPMETTTGIGPEVEAEEATMK